MQRFAFLIKGVPINPAWRYVEQDKILQQLFKDGVKITVQNCISEVGRSELPENLAPENADLLA